MNKSLRNLVNEASYSVAPKSDSESESGEPPDRDTTLPQYRPNDFDLEPATPGIEPFPAFSAPEWHGSSNDPPPESQHEQEPDPTLPQNCPDTADDFPLNCNDSLLVHDITSSTISSTRPGLLSPPPIYKSASTSTSASAPPPQSSHD